MTQKYVNLSDGTYALGAILVDSTGANYTAGGGSSGGLSDTILTDDSATQFLARDSGTAITYVTLAGAPYTPSTNVRAIQIAGGATAANQTTGNTSLASVVTNTNKIPALGQAVRASSVPVTIASDQGNVSVSGTVTANAGTNLNTSALALETGGNLATIATNTGKLPSLGVATSANSIPVTLSSDGAFATNFGAQADSAATTDTGSFTLMGFVKRALQNWTTLLAKVPALVSGRVPVDGSGVTQPVSGTFWQTTQPVSAASLPLPTGAATSANQPTLVSGRMPVDGSGVTQPVSGTFWQATQPVSGTVSSNATQTGTWTVQPGNTANTTAWLTSVNDGTTTASNVAGDSGQNSQVVVGSRKEVSFTTTTAQAVASTDVSNYSWISVHIVAQGGSSVVNFQSSNDNTNWVTCVLMNNNSVSALAGSSSSTAGVIWHGPVSARYFRLNVTGIASGTTSGVVEFFAMPKSTLSNGAAVVQSGTWNVGQSSAYPASSTATTSSSGNVANASAVATLAGVSAKTTYMTGFEVTSSGATVGSVVNITVTGTIGGTMTYTYAAPAGVLAMGTPLVIDFNPPIPSSTTNTSIVVTLPALGAGNTNATVVAHGYTM